MHIGQYLIEASVPAYETLSCEIMTGDSFATADDIVAELVWKRSIVCTLVRAVLQEFFSSLLPFSVDVAQLTLLC